MVIEGNYALPDGTKVEIAKDEDEKKSDDKLIRRLHRLRRKKMKLEKAQRHKDESALSRLSDSAGALYLCVSFLINLRNLRNLWINLP